jgi:predicted nucleic acid-binding protein
MATAQQIRDLIAQTTSGGARLHIPREVRDEVCRYATRRRREGAPWAVIAPSRG